MALTPPPTLPSPPPTPSQMGSGGPGPNIPKKSSWSSKKGSFGKGGSFGKEVKKGFLSGLGYLREAAGNVISPKIPQKSVKEEKIVKKPTTDVLSTLFGSTPKIEKKETRELRKTVMEEIFGGKSYLGASSFKFNIGKIKDFNIPGSGKKMYGRQRLELGSYLLEEYKKTYGNSAVVSKDKLIRLLKKKQREVGSPYYKPSMEKFIKEKGREPKPSEILRKAGIERREFKAYRSWLGKETKERK